MSFAIQQTIAKKKDKKRKRVSHPVGGACP
ncbi:hypothetical protein SCOR_13270 [Sulfidibacter corallicola]